MSDGTEYPATIVNLSDTQDLALVKIDATGLKPATIGDSSGLKVGQTAIAIGSPLGTYTETVTKGIISGLDRTVTVQDDQTGRPVTLIGPDPDRCGDQPRQQRRPAARRHRRGHRRQHGDRVERRGPRVRDPDPGGGEPDRPGAGGLGRLTIRGPSGPASTSGVVRMDPSCGSPGPTLED